MPRAGQAVNFGQNVSLTGTPATIGSTVQPGGAYNRLILYVRYTMGADETNNYLNIRIQSSPDGSTWYDMTKKASVGNMSLHRTHRYCFRAVAAAGTYDNIRIGCITEDPYIRVQVWETGVASAFGTVFVEGFLTESSGIAEEDNFAYLQWRRSTRWTAPVSATLVYAPGGSSVAGHRWVLDGYAVGTTKACKVTLFNESSAPNNRIFEFGFAANGGANLSYVTPLVSTAANARLRLTCSTGAGTVTVWGRDIASTATSS